MNNEHNQIGSFQEQAGNWAQLAQQDPEAFEMMRQKLVDDYIKSTPSEVQQRLECMQWKIEQIRQRADTPAEAFSAITSMMWESTQKLGRSHKDLLDACTGKEVSALSKDSSGKILNFKRITKQ